MVGDSIIQATDAIIIIISDKRNSKRVATMVNQLKLDEFVDYVDGLKKKNGANWPLHTREDFARKAEYALPIIAHLVRDSPDDPELAGKAITLLRNLSAHAQRSMKWTYINPNTI